MENKIPKTKEEAFALLDAMLSEEDKKALKEEDDLFDYHFTLGLWIRNNWIYPLNHDEEKSFLKMFEDVEDSPYFIFTYHPDETSSLVIDKYVEYLKNKS